MWRRSRGRASLFAVALAVGVGGARCGGASPVEVPKPVTAVSLMLSPEKGREFPFGQVVPAIFTLENLSDRAMVVCRIQPVTNRSEEPIGLAGTVYGSLAKDDKTDTYSHNVMSQRATQLPFYVALLLPKQKVCVTCRYRPLFTTERFSVSYATAKAKYDGTAQSLAPFTVYVLKTGASRSPRMAYEPFRQAAWQELSKARHVSPPGPGVSTRGVLIPDFRAALRAEEHEVSVEFTGQAFGAEKALALAAKIAKATPQQIDLAYSAALGGYVVAAGDSAWLLSRPDQDAPGKPLGRLPVELLRDVDTQRDVRIRVGDKQEGFGPDRRLAGWKLWGAYPVEYGDGMYTRGEFVRIDKTNLAAFLEQVRKSKFALKTYRYYFGSRYFILQAPKKRLPARPPRP